MSYESEKTPEPGVVNYELFRKINTTLTNEEIGTKIKVLEHKIRNSSPKSADDLPDLLSETFVQDVAAQSESNPTVLRKQLEILYEIQDARNKEPKQNAA